MLISYNHKGLCQSHVFAAQQALYIHEVGLLSGLLFFFANPSDVKVEIKKGSSFTMSQNKLVVSLSRNTCSDRLFLAKKFSNNVALNKTTNYETVSHQNWMSLACLIHPPIKMMRSFCFDIISPIPKFSFCIFAGV